MKLRIMTLSLMTLCVKKAKLYETLNNDTQDKDTLCKES